MVSTVKITRDIETIMKEQDVLLVLHGNKQTGQLFLGRIDKLTTRVRKEFGIKAIAPDAPFRAELFDEGENSDLRTWWLREGDNYVGLEDSLALVQKIQEDATKRKERIVGILGFSQGARFGHLLSVLHESHPHSWFPGLKFVIFAAGYNSPIPPELLPYCDEAPDSEALFSVPSLHIWGSNDGLVTPTESETLAAQYFDKETYVHPGKHHVPTKGSEIPIYVAFIRKALLSTSSPTNETEAKAMPSAIPEEETASMQREEIQALEAIYPDAIDLRSGRSYSEEDGEDVFEFPIVYRMKLNDMEMDGVGEGMERGSTNWPIHPLTVEIQYPINYPSDDLQAHPENTTVPVFKLLHKNTVFEFPSIISGRLISILNETARNERGMSCILSCLYAAREYLDEDRNWTGLSLTHKASSANTVLDTCDDDQNRVEDDIESQDHYGSSREHHPLIRASTPADIRRGNLEGLEIAHSLLRRVQETRNCKTSNENSDDSSSGGGSFGTYTIGLVGKPSAGKSTFFNAATGFSRQRGQHQDAATGNNVDNVVNSSNGEDLGGASMAAHPFTTIDPNIGYCLVPAPLGSCPEDDEGESIHAYGSTHGRDASGRRFVPVLLKDVAGLVPGAYQGKGRGNQFLNDLTDATVLIHVVDSSGSADSSGNKIVVDYQAKLNETGSDDNEQQQHTNPLDDLAWIRAELVEWVYSNLAAKWVVISRKGRSKLAGMFSGYGQKPEMVETAFVALEAFLEERYHRDRALDKICEWDECDVHRLVSLFLGLRFPMALCLNKYDLPSAQKFVSEIQNSLPVHGALVGTPLSAKKEMNFVKEQMILAKLSSTSSTSKCAVSASPLAMGVWECLNSAIELREPILVFPVSDMVTFAPMPSLNKVATGDPSLPSKGMIRCIKAAGGTLPSNWNDEEENYSASIKLESQNSDSGMKLRDAILMKPGSTVDDVFMTLKRMGALGGEFIRAEASSGASGERPKPVPKQERISRKTRVIKIMTNKRTQWQASATVKKERNRYQSNR